MHGEHQAQYGPDHGQQSYQLEHAHPHPSSEQGDWARLLQPGASSGHQYPQQPSSTTAGGTDMSYPVFYHQPLVEGQHEYSSSRPSTSPLSINLSSLSVAPSMSSSASTHFSPNPVSSPVATTGESTPHQQSYPPPPPAHLASHTQFTFSQPPSSEWHTHPPHHMQHSQSSQVPSEQPASNHSTPTSDASTHTSTPIPSGLRQSASIDENSFTDSAQRTRRNAFNQHDDAYLPESQESPIEGTPSDANDDARYMFDEARYTDTSGASLDASTPQQSGFASSVPRTKAPPANNFVMKLYQMINDSKSESFISWTELGTSFVVSSVGEFSRSILGSHFKHNNFSSFVRQLNMYGFHKINRTPRSARMTSDNQVWEFSHQKFLRGRPDLLDEIKRKANDTDPLRQRVDLPAEVAAQLHRMGHDQQTLVRALQGERVKVERLTHFIKAMHDQLQHLYSNNAPLAFPHDLLEAASDNPPILITSPTDSPFSETPFFHDTSSSSAASSFWTDRASMSSLGTISPSSSPTTSDFPMNRPHLPPSSSHFRQPSSQSLPSSHYQPHPHQHLPPVNISSLPRYDQSYPAQPLSATSPIANDDDVDYFPGSSRAGKRQRMSHQFPGGRSQPSSAVHPTSDRQLPQVARTLARARSEMSLHRLAGGSGRPRSGTQLTGGLRGIGATNLRWEDSSPQASVGISMIAQGNSSGFQNNGIVPSNAGPPPTLHSGGSVSPTVKEEGSPEEPLSS